MLGISGYKGVPRDHASFWELIQHLFRARKRTTFGIHTNEGILDVYISSKELMLFSKASMQLDAPLQVFVPGTRFDGI
jgi:hypothetical protein